MQIQERILSIRSSIPAGVTLVAVSKTKPTELIMQAYDTGQRVFGENRVQELTQKYELLPKDIEWHLIGHLQTNKVKYVAPFVKMIHAVDSLKLLREINKQAEKHQRVIECLLQFHIADEESKFGLDMSTARELLTSEAFSKMKNVRLCGVMGMATYTEDSDKIRHEFSLLKGIYSELKDAFFALDLAFCEISMGMSGDYEIAIEEGSTMIRLGSTIFGDRE